MTEVRSLTNGGWFWIERAVIKTMAPRIGARGIAVYALLASMADRRQRCFPSQGYIARCLGCSPSTVSRAVRRLSELGLIRIGRKGFHFTYELLKAGPVTGTSRSSHGCTRDQSPVHTNKTQLTRLNNKMEIFNSFLPGRERGVEPESELKAELLARDLAVGLRDLGRLSLYRSYVYRFQETILRQCLSEVRSIPESRITRSRAALFAHLLTRHAP